MEEVIKKNRNLNFVVKNSSKNFNAAYKAGIMGIHGRSCTGRHVELEDGHDIVDFVRCSYLGLDNHPKIVKGAIRAIEQYHSLHWSCARTRLNFKLVSELEEKLSSLFAARVVAFPTVLTANMAALPILASGHFTGTKKPIIVFDKFAHATLAYHKPVMAEETEVITIAHNDMNALEEICKRATSPVAYVGDGVYSMGGSAPISELKALQERYGLFVYLDDAHGISLFGEHGEGFVRSALERPALGERTIIAASLGKGFGASGGILMLGTVEQEDLIRRYALPYAFSVGPNLAAIGASLGSAEIHADAELGQLQKALRSNLEKFDRRIHTKQSGEPLPIRMVEIGVEEKAIRVAESFMKSNFYVSATFFPTVARGAAGLRICPTATHTEEEIDKLCNLLAQVPGVKTICKEKKYA
jgi:8-amino-7-oxononanoate synthase